MIGLRTFQSVAKLALIAVPLAGQAAPPELAGTVHLNGLDTYYEAYGDRKPIPIHIYGSCPMKGIGHLTGKESPNSCGLPESFSQESGDDRGALD